MHLLNAGFRRSVISDVERHELDAREGTRHCGYSDAAEDPVATGGYQLGGCPANAGRCTCDQDNAPRSVCHRNSWPRRRLDDEVAASLKAHRQKMFKIIFWPYYGHVAEDEAMPYSPKQKRDTREKILESASEKSDFMGLMTHEYTSKPQVQRERFFRRYW